MQQFTVPQFIDVEDKVIGPVSVRQFIILLITFGAVALGYKLFDFTLFLVSGIIFVCLGFAFAFIKINGMPLHYFILNIIQTFKAPHLRIWSKRDQVTEVIVRHSNLGLYSAPPTPQRFSASRLNQLSLIVDTKGYYKGEEGENVNIKAVGAAEDLDLA